MASSSGLLCRLEDLKQELGIDSTNHVNDLSMELAIETAGQEIADYTGRRFVLATGQVRYYTARESSRLLVDDILAITSLRTDNDQNGSYETTLSTAAYLLAPFNATLQPYPSPYTEIVIPEWSSGSFPTGITRGVQITGDWGYATAVPPVVKKACLFQAALSFRAKDAPFGAIGGRDFGQEITAPISQGLHPFSKKMLDFYRIRVVA